MQEFITKYNRQADEKKQRDVHLSDLKAGAGLHPTTGECYKWRNDGVCEKHKSKDCPYTHLKENKGVGKQGLKGDGKGKKGGKKGDGKGKRDRSSSPRPSSGTGKPSVVLDATKVCKKYLLNQCTAGKNCRLHHNPPCSKQMAGECTRTECLFPHWNAVAAVSTPATVAQPKANAKPKPKPAAKAGADR